MGEPAYDWLDTAVWVVDAGRHRRWTNRSGQQLWALLGLQDPLTPAQAEAMLLTTAESSVDAGANPSVEWTLPMAGRRFSLRSHYSRVLDPDHRPLLLVEVRDVSEHEDTRRRLSSEKLLLEMISRNRPLRTVLRELVAGVERECPGMMCAVHEVREGRMYGLVAPNLDKAYSAALEGIAIGPSVGSCGAAAHSRRRVIVTDIATDARWKNHRELALGHGLRACWSIPVTGTEGEVLGTFAAYYHSPRAPTDAELQVLESAKHIAGIAIERRRAESVIEQSRELLQMTLDAMPLLVAYADTDLRYRFVNRAFEEWFGTKRGDALGRHTREIIGPALFERIRPMIEDACRGREVRFEQQRVDPEGRPCHVDIRYLPHLDADGKVLGHFGIVHDITDRKEKERILQHLATHDQLTQLPNRALIGEHLQMALRRSRRSGHRLAVLFIDLDRFKEVNDTLGHEAGDHLLRQVTARFRENVRASDAIGRLGGDEFVVLMDGIRDGQEAGVLAQKLLQVLQLPIRIDGQDVAASASIGIAVAPEDGDDPATLLKHADVAMYRAKQEGRSGYRFFSPGH